MVIFNEIEELAKNDKVLYIYQTGLQIYDLFKDIHDTDYTVIIDDNYDLLSTDHITVYKIKDWFDHVLKGDIIAWECACLPKKFIVKEYVKLLMTTNPLQLRKNYENLIGSIIPKAKCLVEEGNSLSGQKLLWQILKYIKFANQIIENHKIVNFKEVTEDYKYIVDGQVGDGTTIYQTFLDRINQPLQLFKKYTDSIYRTSKMKSIIQK